MRKIINSGKWKTRLETIILTNFACGTISPSAWRSLPLQVIIVDAGLENTCVILLRVAVILHFSRNCSRQLLVDQNVQYK